ncbi:MAG: flagellar export chaperone FliS [Pseudomonadota bacterium]|jgi:flagellar protein FliS
MFAVMHNPTAAYNKVGIETGVQAADPHKLILMLFEGAMISVSAASLHMEHEEIAPKGEAISKAINIITNGLKASLDMNVGGELAVKLDALYEYMVNRLLFANLNNNQAALGEVSHLLAELKSAWEQIGQQANAVQPHAA